MTLQLNEDHIQKCRYLFLTIELCFLLSAVLFVENVKKLSRNLEYLKSQKAKKLLALRPDLSFLQYIKKVHTQF